MEQEKCENKKCFHHLLETVWPLMPDHLHDILHSLDMQKLAVLREVKEWADAHDQKDLALACEMKIEKIENRIHLQEGDME